MSAKKNKLNQLNVIAPCSSSWDRMTGNGQKRFCSECSKNVYDFSQMAQSQIEAVVSAKRGNLCARITRREDGSILMMEPPVLARSSNRRASPMAAATLAAILGISAPVTAQSSLVPTVQPGTGSFSQDRQAPDKKPVSGATASIKGTISDPQGAVIAGAKVKLMSGSDLIGTTSSSTEGGYGFPGIAPGNYSLMIEAAGFRGTVITDIQALPSTETPVNATLDIKFVAMGGVIAAPPATLLRLYQESDLIAMATVGQSVPVKTEQESSQFKTMLHLTSLLKGEARRNVIPFYHWESGEDGEAIKPGDQVLIFLDQRKSEDGKHSDGYEASDWSRAVKKLDAAALSAFRQRLEELPPILRPDQTDESELTEWLIRCIENPATRWDGTYELRRRTDSPAIQDGETEDEAPADRAGQKNEETNLLASLAPALTQPQKDRILSVLFNLDSLQEDDLELVELAQSFKDTRLPGYLIGQLQKIVPEAPEIAESLTALIATSLNDEALQKLADDYSESAEYGDDQAEEEDDQEHNQNQPPSVAAQIATAKRSALLGKFLTAVELKLYR